MGFTFNGIHSGTFGLHYITSAIPILPGKRTETVYPLSKDGGYTFEDGYNNRIIDLSCVISANTIPERREKARKIAEWLSKKGSLVFDSDPGIEYEVVKSTNNIISEFNYATEDFNINFECKPYMKRSFDTKDVIWNNAAVTWKNADFPWMGSKKSFEVQAGDEITVVNAGTYKAMPLIKLSGIANNIEMMGFSFKNLSGIVYIDTENMLVYKINGQSKENAMKDFSGAFQGINSGENKYLVNGQITNLSINIDFRDTYI